MKREELEALQRVVNGAHGPLCWSLVRDEPPCRNTRLCLCRNDIERAKAALVGVVAAPVEDAKDGE